MIGMDRARKTAAYGREVGDLQKVSDLLKVPGIGQGTLRPCGDWSFVSATCSTGQAFLMARTIYDKPARAPLRDMVQACGLKPKQL